jgi:mannan endo-1,4-beta-mannosidase
VASFEKLKEIFGGRKLITLSENGSVPFPDEMKTDGAGWSYFMPWYGDYTMDGWAHDNTAADWKKIMNSDYVLTLDEMPGWQNIKVPVSGNLSNKINNHIVARFANNNLTITYNNAVIINTVELYKLDGSYITSLKPEVKTKGRFEIDATSITQGTYIIKCIETSGNITIHKVAKLCKS